MKKLVTLFFLTALVLLTGCSRQEAGARASQPLPNEPDIKTVGIIQLADNGAFTDMRNGFLDRMKELGYSESSLKIDYRNAQGDTGTLNTICQEMANAKYDLVVPVVTPATQAFVNLDSGIPVVFISVTNPVAAGIMSSLDKPDKNATGTSNLVPVDEIFKLAKALTPGVKNFGILYNSGESNAVTTVRKAKEYLDANGYSYVESTVANSSDVQQAAEALAGKVDAVYVPIDSMVQSAMPQVAAIAKDAKKPVYGSSPVMVVSGALATVSVSDRQCGVIAADMADKYFKGTPIADIPAVTLNTFTTVINKTTAGAIGVSLPASLSQAVLIGK
ncbi:MAG: ABC transporter substrate-binding protein [Spirochaetales bacterium]|jgi:putative ABC transport system substrate-binding protein|nr:ABC transporter substrate-binding protein [Spirochaetales bacterium]